MYAGQNLKNIFLGPMSVMLWLERLKTLSSYFPRYATYNKSAIHQR